MKKAILILIFQSLMLFISLGQITDLQIDSGFIEVDGGRLYYEMAWNGEKIVLLHDGMVSNEIWDYQFPVLAKYYRKSLELNPENENAINVLNSIQGEN